MNLKTLIIHKNKTLYNILEEISNYINFKTIYSENLDINLDSEFHDILEECYQEVKNK